MDFLRWIIGNEAHRIPEGATVEFSFTSAPQSWAAAACALAALALGALVFFGYAREMEVCPRWVKRLLACLRCAALAVLALALLNPALTYVQVRETEPWVVVARDDSQSMSTDDRYQDEPSVQATALATGITVEELRRTRPTRAALVNELLARDEGAWLKELSQKGRLRYLNFAHEVVTLPHSAPGETPPLTALGRGTDLARAIDEASAQSPTAAVVLLTDGQHTSASDPRAAARRAAQRNVPLLVVGVGDASRPRNLRLANVYVRPQVWPNEPFEVRGLLWANDVGARGVQVDLLVHALSPGSDQPGPGTVVERRRVELKEAGGQTPLEFKCSLDKPGRYSYSLQVERLDEEQVADDNQRFSSPVLVLDKAKVRILLVSSSPSWEYRLLQPLLERDRTVRLSCWLQSLDDERAQSGSDPIVKLPSTEAELFKYDAVVLLDPHPSDFTEEWMNLLEKFVSKHAGGLLYMAGPKHSANLLTDRRAEKLRTMLPVRFSDLAAIEVAALLSTNTRDWPLRALRSNADHPLMRFYQDWQESLARWENLPGIYWSFPALGPKPSAKLLLEHSDPTLRRVEGSRPLMVAGRYGSGHVVYLGFNGTWRWRRAGVEGEFFDRFWVRTAHYLAEGRSLKGQRRGFLQAERERYELGDKAILVAELHNAAFQPITLPTVEATLHVGDAPALPTPLVAVAGQPGQYRALVPTRQIGLHTVKLNLPRSPGEEAIADGALPLEATFQVELPSAEAGQTWMNRPLLRELAELSGGRYFELNEMSQVAGAIPDRREKISIPGKPITLWDNQWVLYLAVLLLGLEWAVRKAYRLL